MNFCPDDITCSADGVFGLPTTTDEARIVIIPTPFDGTTTDGDGTIDGPQAVRDGSDQIDLYDLQFGRVYDAGIAMAPAPDGLRDCSDQVRSLAAPILHRGHVRDEDANAIDTINARCANAESLVFNAVHAWLAKDKIVGVLGGEHSMSQGAIRAVIAHERRSHADATIGVLQIDAHMDLHSAYASMTYSHASVMRNALDMFEGVSRLVQVGIRDVAERELTYAREHGDRIATHFDIELWRRMDSGETWRDICTGIVDSLPERVYITFDIDGLDPSLCPHTGTPVPGGLSFNQACILLETLAKSQRRIVGFDLVEVAPGPPGASRIDANVGARILYKLCGAAAAT